MQTHTFSGFTLVNHRSLEVAEKSTGDYCSGIFHRSGFLWHPADSSKALTVHHGTAKTLQMGKKLRHDVTQCVNWRLLTDRKIRAQYDTRRRCVHRRHLRWTWCWMRLHLTLSVLTLVACVMTTQQSRTLGVQICVFLHRVNICSLTLSFIVISRTSAAWNPTFWVYFDQWICCNLLLSISV